MTTTSKFFLDIVQLEPVSFVLLSDKFWRRRTKFFVAAAAAWPAAAASWWSRRRPRLPGSPSWGQACWCKIGPFQLETEKTVKVIACWRKKNGRRLSRFLNCYQTIWWLVAAPAGPGGAMALPDFDKSVNPTSTEGQIMPPTTCPPDLQTFQRHWSVCKCSRSSDEKSNFSLVEYVDISRSLPNYWPAATLAPFPPPRRRWARWWRWQQ